MRHLSFITALLVFSVPIAAQQQVYRWVDDKGVTHFGAKPPENKEATRIDAKAAPNPSGSSAAPQPAATADNKKTSSPANSSEQPVLDEDQMIKELMEQEAEYTQFCEQNRTNLTQLRNNPRLRYTDDNGETHTVTEEIRQQRIVEAEQNIKDFCQ